MCRKNQILGIALASFGVGLVVSGLFESFFWCCCVGMVTVVVGFSFGRK